MDNLRLRALIAVVEYQTAIITGEVADSGVRMHNPFSNEFDELSTWLKKNRALKNEDGAKPSSNSASTKCLKSNQHTASTDARNTGATNL